MAYTVFTGRDGQNASFQWVTQKINGVDATVLVLDVGGAPVSTGNPLPVAVQGTAAVSIAATVPVREPALAAILTSGGGTATTASSVLIAANGSRHYVEIANGGTSGIWIRFAASAATSGQGSYLPAKASNIWAYSGEVRITVETGGTSGPVGYTEW